MSISEIVSKPDDQVVADVARETVLRPGYVRQVLKAAGFFELKTYVAGSMTATKGPSPKAAKAAVAKVSRVARVVKRAGILRR